RNTKRRFLRHHSAADQRGPSRPESSRRSGANRSSSSGRRNGNLKCRSQARLPGCQSQPASVSRRVWQISRGSAAAEFDVHTWAQRIMPACNVAHQCRFSPLLLNAACTGSGRGKPFAAPPVLLIAVYLTEKLALRPKPRRLPRLLVSRVHPTRRGDGAAVAHGHGRLGKTCATRAQAMLPSRVQPSKVLAKCQCKIARLLWYSFSSPSCSTCWRWV